MRFWKKKRNERERKLCLQGLKGREAINVASSWRTRSFAKPSTLIRADIFVLECRDRAASSRELQASLVFVGAFESRVDRRRSLQEYNCFGWIGRQPPRTSTWTAFQRKSVLRLNRAPRTIRRISFYHVRPPFSVSIYFYGKIYRIVSKLICWRKYRSKSFVQE